MVYYLGVIQELGQHPEEGFLDGDPRQIALQGPLTAEMQAEIALNKTHQFNIGFPVEAHNVPTIWQWASSRPIPDYYTPHGFPSVSPRMKEIIESFETDVHQFFALKVVDKRGEQIAERFLWVVCNWIDSVDRQHTTLILRRGQRWVHPKDLSDDELPDSFDHMAPIKLLFDAEKIAGHHFWRDKYLKQTMINASDESGKALIGAELTGLIVRTAEVA